MPGCPIHVDRQRGGRQRTDPTRSTGGVAPETEPVRAPVRVLDPRRHPGSAARAQRKAGDATRRAVDAEVLRRRAGAGQLLPAHRRVGVTTTLPAAGVGTGRPDLGALGSGLDHGVRPDDCGMDASMADRGVSNRRMVSTACS